MAQDSTPVHDTALARLGHALYQRALVRREDEAITDPRGQPIGWLLDTRTPMLDGAVFNEAGGVIAERLRLARRRRRWPATATARSHSSARSSRTGRPESAAQAAALSVSAASPTAGGASLRVRSTAASPVALADDILNSGRSAARAVALLRSGRLRGRRVS